MDIQKELLAYEQSLQDNGFFKVENIGMCTVFDPEQNKYHPSDLCDPKEYKFIDMLNVGWTAWQAAKASAVPEGFVLMPVKEIKTWYLNDNESIYLEDPDWLCDIPVGEVVEVERRVSYELNQDPVFAAIQWDEENKDVGYYETFEVREDAEKAAAHCKAMKLAQEQANADTNS